MFTTSIQSKVYRGKLLLILCLIHLCFFSFKNDIIAESASTLCISKSDGKIFARKKCKKSESILTSKALSESLVISKELSSKGEKGDKGDKGDKGEKGDQGVPGIQGHQGSTGAQGPKGEQGAKGDTGLTGAPGQNAKPNISVYDIQDQLIGPVLQTDCPFNSDLQKFNLVTLLIKISDRSYYVCVSRSGFNGFEDILFPTNDCSGNGYVDPSSFPSNDKSLVVPSVLANNGGKAILYELDYSNGLKTITYHSYLSGANGICHMTTSGPYQLRAITNAVDLSSLYLAPFIIK